jgi:putative ABC transport system permease protein
MRSRMIFFQVLACCISMIACHQSDSRRDRPAPPETSYRVESLPLTTGAASHSIRAALVTPAFFEAVREQPVVGRSFHAEEYQSTDRPVVVLSHGLWQHRFRADPAVIGESVTLGGRAHTIVGVMPQGFDTPAGAEAWLPQAESDR